MNTLSIALLCLALGSIGANRWEEVTGAKKVSVDCLREVPRVVLVRGE